jgi:hypothetical protein
MARPRFLKAVRRVNITIESELHSRAVKTAGHYGFSDLVSRLLVAELRRKNGIAHRTPRSLSTKRG